MKVLIFEGIATSGKSTLIHKLDDVLSNQVKIHIAGEEETHIPIMHATSELHLSFFENLINAFRSLNTDIIFIDRLYLTQALRAKTSLVAYKQVEDLLKSLNPMTVFLKVKPTAIAERIHNATLHREASWGEYVATKGETLEERAAYYINQQESQLALLKQSSLKYMIFDTTLHNYSEIADKILAIIKD